MSSMIMAAGAPGRYIHWGVIQISVTNLLIIGAMVLLFILALVVPFPSDHGEADEQSEREGRHP